MTGVGRNSHVKDDDRTDSKSASEVGTSSCMSCLMKHKVLVLNLPQIKIGKVTWTVEKAGILRSLCSSLRRIVRHRKSDR
jgi:hypothetical protein